MRMCYINGSYLFDGAIAKKRELNHAVWCSNHCGKVSTLFKVVQPNKGKVVQSNVCQSPNLYEFIYFPMQNELSGVYVSIC